MVDDTSQSNIKEMIIKKEKKIKKKNEKRPLLFDG